MDITPGVAFNIYSDFGTHFFQGLISDMLLTIDLEFMGMSVQLIEFLLTPICITAIEQL